ncbi:hypothetical protein [Clostridium neuense]|uniref:hypothetical protein n=1 Tax=Clostridium neuense TaxID=1728934 RepID=UPI0038779064
MQNVEKRIYDIEGFEVNILSFNGKNIRSDASLPKQYEAVRMTKNSFSVTEWRTKFILFFFRRKKSKCKWKKCVTI